LIDWEAKRDEKTSSKEHERKWPEEKVLRDEIEKLRVDLNSYAEALRKIADVK
jgi:hypothetical protein